MTEEPTAAYLPFHALNEFMNDEYRLEVIRNTLQSLNALSSTHQSTLQRLTKKLVSIPGFRNSQKAPLMLKVREMVPIFKKNPDLVAAIVSAWASLHTQLSQDVYQLLTEREWEILPVDADRTRLPGFHTVWPQGEDFVSLTSAYREKYPQAEAEDNDISLMVVWLSNRLPYETAG